MKRRQALVLATLMWTVTACSIRVETRVAIRDATLTKVGADSVWAAAKELRISLPCLRPVEKTGEPVP